MRFIIPPTNYILSQQITHALRIPVATFQSRFRLQSVIQRLRDDPSTGALPSIAWTSVDSLAIPRQIAMACELLRGFDVTSYLEEDTTVLLSVDLRGLHSSIPGERRAFTNRLYTSLINPATVKSLQRLYQSLRALFEQSKFLVTNNCDSNGPMTPAHVKLMNTMRLRSDQMTTKPKLEQYNLNRAPLYDARDLYETYGDSLWVENIPLERICLTDLRLMDFVKRGEVVGTGYRSLLSIPLPGASNEVIAWEDPEVRYVPAACAKRRKNPITPLIIPSNSHPIAVDPPGD